MTEMIADAAHARDGSDPIRSLEGWGPDRLKS
jgi:hypothetical protein